MELNTYDSVWGKGVGVREEGCVWCGNVGGKGELNVALVEKEEGLDIEGILLDLSNNFEEEAMAIEWS